MLLLCKFASILGFFSLTSCVCFFFFLMFFGTIMWKIVGNQFEMEVLELKFFFWVCDCVGKCLIKCYFCLITLTIWVILEKNAKNILPKKINNNARNKKINLIILFFLKLEIQKKLKFFMWFFVYLNADMAIKIKKKIVFSIDGAIVKNCI